MADNRNKKKNSSNYLKQGSILAVASIFVRVIGMLYRIPVTRIIGNEGNGLRPETAAACRGRLTIAMAGRAESLNASMAAGIILWELMRPQE